MIWRQEISPPTLSCLSFGTTMSIGGMSFLGELRTSNSPGQRRGNALTASVLVFLLLAATPGSPICTTCPPRPWPFLSCFVQQYISSLAVLKTLTETYSDDTVVIMACMFICVHLLTHDYQVRDPRSVAALRHSHSRSGHSQYPHCPLILTVPTHSLSAHSTLPGMFVSTDLPS